MARRNELPVFGTLACATGAVLVAQAPLPLLAGLGGSRIGFWLASTAAAALTAPYLAHVAVVAYFALTQPTRPIVLDPGEPWDEDTAQGEA